MRKSMNNVAYQEIKSIFKYRPVWVMLAIQDIQLRYRRSSLGPWWLTISMSITIYTMGFLYSHLFNLNLESYFPYLASGIICWSFLSTLILETTNAFIESECYIKNNENLFSSFIVRIIFRNLIVLFHNFIAFIPIIFLFNLHVDLHYLSVIPGLFIICINAFFFGMIFAGIGTRYRDFHQILSNLVQVSFFLTPVMWMPQLLPEKYQWIILYNPLYQFLNLIRAPLINESISQETIVIVSAVTISGFLLFSRFIKKFRYTVIFWL